MNKLISICTASIVAVMAVMLVPNAAEARRYRHGNDVGAAVAAAVIGGIIIAGISHRRHHRDYYYNSYDDDYGYDAYPRHRYNSYYSGSNYNYSRSPISITPFGTYGGGHHHHHW